MSSRLKLSSVWQCISILKGDSTKDHALEQEVKQTRDSPSRDGKLYIPVPQNKVLAARAVYSDFYGTIHG